VRLAVGSTVISVVLMISRTVVNATTTPGSVGSDRLHTYHLGQGPETPDARPPRG
jgi:hypothetical protein